MHKGNKDQSQTVNKVGSIQHNKPHYLLKKFIENYDVMRDLIHHPRKICEHGENPE
jgi:hypothetical protein